MASIVSNQRAAFVSRAMSDSRALIASLHMIGPAEQAVILATVAAAIRLPVDIKLWGEQPDWEDARRIADGVLTRDGDDWEINAGTRLRIEEAPEDHHV